MLESDGFRNLSLSLSISKLKGVCKNIHYFYILKNNLLIVAL